MNVVRIPAGVFRMGSSEDGEGAVFENETPQHAVYVDAFQMDATPVTNADWAHYCRLSGARLPKHWNRRGFDAPEQPVVGVTWEAASRYAEWFGKRLPTEAEWERAARGGLDGRRFPWGDDEPDHSRANYDNVLKRTTSVGTYPSNPYGLYDMAGSVWEWCSDAYESDYYASYRTTVTRNPTGPATGSRRVIRGGSWQNFATMLRCAYRGFLNPSAEELFVGFRCVRDA